MIQKTGILGGTFDPVHNGHLALAAAAGKLCTLNEIILLPAAVPPHKQNQKITEYSHRVAMLDCAANANPLLHVSQLEKQLPSPSFTIDTLRYMQLHSVAAPELYFIIGADAFLDIVSWRMYHQVLYISNFIVFLREGYGKKKLYSLLQTLGYHEDQSIWRSRHSKKVIHTSTVLLPPVSSSMVRQRVKDRKSLEGLLPEGVTSYIRKQGLYQSLPN